MTRRLAVLALAAGALFLSTPAHAESVCVSHDLRPTANVYGIACVDTTDPNFISCGGRLFTLSYACA